MIHHADVNLDMVYHCNVMLYNIEHANAIQHTIYARHELFGRPHAMVYKEL